MKKIILSICGICFLSSVLYSQIGIHTQNPKSILHIDGLQNNPATGDSSVIQQKDDVYFSKDGDNLPSLKIGTMPANSNSDAQLELASQNKGFLPNRVPLKSTLDVATIPIPIDGMIVYNTATAGSGEDKVIPGLYVYYDSKWRYIFTKGYKIPTIRTIKSDLELGKGGSTEPDKATVALYDSPIEIEENGAYAFAFRLYYRGITSIENRTRVITYIWLFKNGDVKNPIDIAELNPTIFDNASSPKQDYATYSVVLSAELKKGDKITVGFSRNGATPSLKLTNDNTVGIRNNLLVYWRIEQYNK